MKAKEIKRLSDDELKDELRQAEQELFNARFQHGTRQLKNYQTLTAGRKRIARALQAMGEREKQANG